MKLDDQTPRGGEEKRRKKKRVIIGKRRPGPQVRSKKWLKKQHESGWGGRLPKKKEVARRLKGNSGRWGALFHQLALLLA